VLDMSWYWSRQAHLSVLEYVASSAAEESAKNSLQLKPRWASVVLPL
jgi:hypothetical protein